MIIIDGGHAQKHKDNRFRGTWQHFQCIFDGCMGFLWDIRFDIVFHGYATEGNAESVQKKERKGKDNRDDIKYPKSHGHLRQNTAHMEYFSIQIRQISHDENEDRFNDTYMIGETGHQTG